MWINWIRIKKKDRHSYSLESPNRTSHGGTERDGGGRAEYRVSARQMRTRQIKTRRNSRELQWVEDRSRSSDRSSSWKIGLKIHPQKTRRGLVGGGVGRRRKKMLLSTEGPPSIFEEPLPSIFEEVAPSLVIRPIFDPLFRAENRRWGVLRSSGPKIED